MRLHLLGTGAALSDPHRTTTMLAVADEESVLAVDCGGDLVQRLLAAGCDLDALRALVLTHEHPDHVGGFPLFMEKIWLAGRRRPLPVCGIAPALDQARRAFATFDTSRWKGLPRIDWRETPHAPGALVWEDERWRITGAPVEHGVPNIGLRIAHRPSGRVVAYSSDTAPCDAVVGLARGADVLVHEATGAVRGHASAEDAAQIAARAGAGRLLLVHLPPGLTDDDLAGARRHHAGVELGEEGGVYDV